MIGSLLLACLTATPTMAREQIFFVGRDPHPALVALIFQREPTARGATAEAKLFLAWKGELRPPFWERVELPVWPGEGLDEALDAWQAARSGRDLRVRWLNGARRFEVTVRTPGGEVELIGERLVPAGDGRDPHGSLTWRTGLGRLVVNGAEVRGLVVAESLARAEVPWPRFGRFEMWLGAPEEGGLLLGRAQVGEDGRALSSDGRAAKLVPFSAQALASTTDAATRFSLPTKWRIGPTVYTRAAGDLARGLAPGGGPALYDIALAVGEGAQALVFHLQDRP